MVARTPKLKVEITADASKMTKAIKSATRGATRALRGIGTAAKFASVGVGAIAAASAGAAYAVYRLTKSYAENLDALDEQAQAIGRDAQSLREWQDVAEKAGVGSEELVSAFGKMSLAVGQMRNGQGALNKVLTEHGGKAWKAQILGATNAEEAQRALFDAVRQATTEEGKQAIVKAAFGRAGLKMLPIIKQTNEALDAQRETFRRLRGVVTPDQVQKASDYTDAVRDLSTAFGGLKDAVGSELVKAATPMVKSMTEWLSENRGKVAEQISGAVQNMAKALGEVNWSAVGESMISAARSVADILAGAHDMVYALTGRRGGRTVEIVPLGMAPATAAEEGLPSGVRKAIARSRSPEASREAMSLGSQSPLALTSAERVEAYAWGQEFAGTRGLQSSGKQLARAIGDALSGQIKIVVEATGGAAVSGVRATGAALALGVSGR